MFIEQLSQLKRYNDFSFMFLIFLSSDVGTLSLTSIAEKYFVAILTQVFQSVLALDISYPLRPPAHPAKADMRTPHSPS